jgi:TolB-like protein/Tfp pilus assembly protein PilF
MPNISRLINQLAREMRRRKVFRVVAIYAVAAWVILQLAEIVFEPMGYPDWALRGLIISAIVGFPVAFILAWVIDIKPEGLIFDLPLFSSNEDAPRQRRTSDLIFASLLIAILAGGSYYLVDLLVEDTSQVERTEAVDVAQEGNSIAVLAFENFDGDSETDYFGAGLADEILHVLAGIPELNVSSRTSSFQFRGKRMDIRDVAERLGVKNVLEGSARQQGNKIRVGAKLVDGSNGFNKWVKQYERSLDDIFSIQQEIAESVVDELKIVLSIDSIKRLDRQVTSSTDAYVEYLQGVGRLRSSLDADVMREASQYFQHSVTIDPEFARAYAGICEVHLRLYEISKGVADFELAETACEKSSALDPGLNSEIHLALGKLYGYRGWFDRAEEQLNKAISLIPDSADAHIELSRIRVGQGQSESAERLLLKAQSMKSRYWATHEALASFYYRNDQYDDAVREYEKAIKLAPEVATSHAGMGAAFWMMGKHEKAIEAYQASLDIKPSRQALTNIGS